MAKLARHQILHMLLVVFGFRESISSTLRNIILSPSLPIVTAPTDKSSLVGFARSFAATPSPRCYIVFATPREAVVLQKDFDTAKMTHGDEFIVQTNHDVDHTMCCAGSRGTEIRANQVLPTNLLGGEIWLEESIERQDVLRRQWVAHTHRGGSSSADNVKVNGTSSAVNGDRKSEYKGTCVDTVASLEAEAAGKDRTSQKMAPGITRQTLERWLTTYPVSNECTHFATIMDPMRGTIVFLQRGPEESESESEREA
jgi:hypothetical protein